ncbi:hypothetical protein [Pedobacter steynii]|uniref:hypothetical protein n=1 Tax=Pedobacter steynii TaxID=430522 RepID=UPI0012FBE829|nr:hypothetical protein [Pedobacter steynii]
MTVTPGISKLRCQVFLPVYVSIAYGSKANILRILRADLAINGNGFSYKICTL